MVDVTDVNQLQKNIYIILTPCTFIRFYTVTQTTWVKIQYET